MGPDAARDTGERFARRGGLRTQTSAAKPPGLLRPHKLTAYIEPDHPRYGFNEMHDRLYGKGFTIYAGKGASQDTFRLATWAR